MSLFASRTLEDIAAAASGPLWLQLYWLRRREVIASFERRLIESTLESTGGVQKDAARLLGLKPTTLNEMIKRHNIVLPRDRERRTLKEIDNAVTVKTTSA